VNGRAIGELLSMNVGVPRDVEWDARIVHTGIWKEPVDGRRMVRRLNIDGDRQGDVNGHGGPNRAVFVYQIQSYRYWEEVLGRDDFVYGQFGENFTVDGLADGEVCVGDRYKIGDAVFEVSQPRVTCYRVGIRLSEPRMPALLVAHHRPGFYLRVLQEGEVGAGDEIELLERGPEAMTVAEIDALLYLPDGDRQAVGRALRIPALSGGWQGSFRHILEAPTAPPPPAWSGLRPLRVATIDHETASVISLHLVPIDDTPLPPALTGQYLTIRLQPSGPDGDALLRTYSLSDRAGPDGYRISVKREIGGAASDYLHAHVHVGDIVDAGAPRGSFILQPARRPVVFLSAGIGATPVLAMLHALASEHAEQQVWWLHGARNTAEQAFATEVDELLTQLPNHHRVICYSRPDRTDHDFDVTGRLTGDVLAQHDIPDDADFYLCGPLPFMHDLTTALAERGVPNERINQEIFGPTGPITPGIDVHALTRPHPPPGGAGIGPTVAFSRSNLTVRWDPAFPNLLALAEACDIPVRWSCRTGVCHTCESPLISGDITYQPEPLDPPPTGTVLLCCTRPLDDTVIEI
jgi:ferredoxin-NADP reductase/MOSC domain-containing protein YiiM